MPTDTAVDVTMPVRSACTWFSIFIASSTAISSPCRQIVRLRRRHGPGSVHWRGDAVTGDLFFVGVPKLPRFAANRHSPIPQSCQAGRVHRHQPAPDADVEVVTAWFGSRTI